MHCNYLIHTHTRSHTYTHKAHLGKHSSREVINQFYGFLWESFLLSNQASSLPPLLPSSLPLPQPSFLYFHLYQFCLTSENDPHQPINFNPFCPIPLRDNWSKLEGELFLCGRYEIRLLQLAALCVCALNFAASGHKPEVEELDSVSRMP